MIPAAWMEDALCAQVDPDLWFPDKGARAAPARRICMQCPVRVPCAQAGQHERHGIWGGITRHDRQDKAA